MTENVAPKTALDAAVVDLAILRQREAEAKAALDELRQELEQSLPWQYWSKRLQEAKESLQAVDASLRQAALDAYAGSGDRHPHPAVTVRLSAKLSYDPDKARQWTLDHLPAAVKIDFKTFEQHAKAISRTDPLPFVEITQEPQVTISANLGNYLLGPDPDEGPAGDPDEGEQAAQEEIAWAEHLEQERALSEQGEPLPGEIYDEMPF